MEESIVFRPEIDNRAVDRAADEIQQGLNQAGEITPDVDTRGLRDALPDSLPVNFDGMGGIGGGGGLSGLGGPGGLGGVGGGGGGGVMEKLGGISEGVGALSGKIGSKLPGAVAGVSASAAMPVALAGAVGLGLASSMASASNRMGTSATMLSQAWNAFFRPVGDKIDQLFIRDIAQGLLDTATNFEQLWNEEGPMAAGKYLVTEGFSWVVDSITGLATDFAEWSLSVPGKIWDWLKKQDIPGSVVDWIKNQFPDVGGLWPGWPNIGDLWPGWPDLGGLWPGWPDIGLPSGFWPDLDAASILSKVFPSGLTLDKLMDYITGGGGGSDGDSGSEGDSGRETDDSVGDTTRSGRDSGVVDDGGGSGGGGSGGGSGGSYEPGAGDPGSGSSGPGGSGPPTPVDPGGPPPGGPQPTPFAEGGIVRRPTQGVVGEQGGEAVLPLDSFLSDLEASISSALRDTQASGGGGGDLSGVEGKLDRLHRDMNQLRRALESLSLDVDGETLARASVNGQQDELVDVDAIR